MEHVYIAKCIVYLTLHLHTMYVNCISYGLLTGAQASIIVKPDPEDDGLLSVFSHGSWKTFEVDKVFGIHSTQEQVLCYVYIRIMCAQLIGVLHQCQQIVYMHIG